MTAPRRIRLRRTRGWRKPAGAVVVSRPTRFGNPRPMTDTVDPAAWFAAAIERRRLHDLPPEHPMATYPSDDEIAAALAGKDLACWCRLDRPCHADVLLQIANRKPAEVTDAR